MHSSIPQHTIDFIFTNHHHLFLLLSHSSFMRISMLTVSYFICSLVRSDAAVLSHHMILCLQSSPQRTDTVSGVTAGTQPSCHLITVEMCP